MADIFVECCKRRCKHKHWESARNKVPSGDTELRSLGVSDMVCPACCHNAYYRIDEGLWPEKESVGA